MRALPKATGPLLPVANARGSMGERFCSSVAGKGVGVGSSVGSSDGVGSGVDSGGVRSRKNHAVPPTIKRSTTMRINLTVHLMSIISAVMNASGGRRKD